MSNENTNINWMGEGGINEEIYRENILDHYRKPRNFGKLDKFDYSSKEVNSSCGDNFEIFISSKDKKVKKVGFSGNGCAISTASMSMLTEKMKGLEFDDLRKISDEEILGMIGISLGIVRRKCGLLSLKILRNILKEVSNE